MQPRKAPSPKNIQTLPSAQNDPESPNSFTQILVQYGFGDAMDYLYSRDGEALKERIDRLRLIDPDYRADRLSSILPGDQLHPRLKEQTLLNLWRAAPAGGLIRPGDWVALDRGYAEQHLGPQGAKVVHQLRGVSPLHVMWAGTDRNEFFYIPKGLTIRHGANLMDFVKALTLEQIQRIEWGEQASLQRFEREIDQIKNEILAHHDEEACGVHHGPSHWNRVQLHAQNAARSRGIDPLVPTLFAWVHDSQRENEDWDPDHGARAAAFVLDRREDLFGFLNDKQIEDLRCACDLHSAGQTHGNATVQCCWDADRLDLWRVGIEPDPIFLCHEDSYDANTIRMARALWEQDEECAPALTDRRLENPKPEGSDPSCSKRRDGHSSPSF